MSKSSKMVSKSIFQLFFICSTLLHAINGSSNRVIYLNSDNSRPVPPLSHNTKITEMKKPITMSIYYETLCPDSVTFLQNQLLPLFEPQVLSSSDGISQNNHSDSHIAEFDIDSLLDIRLIPYGKAMTLESTEVNKPYAFLCQHGPLECEGNKLHSCALDAATKPFDKSPLSPVTNHQLVNFLLCTMKFLITPKDDLAGISLKSGNLTSFSSSALDACISKMSNSTKLKSDIEICIQDQGQGAHILKNNGELTSTLDPKLYYVPWLTFNGAWTKGNMEQGQKDVKKALCSHLLTPQTFKFFTILDCPKYMAEKDMPPKLLKLWEHQPANNNGKRDGRGIVESEKYQKIKRMIMRTRPSNRAVLSGGRVRDRRGFLHGNNDMGGLSQGGASWRWRTNIHSNPGSEWRWRKSVAIPTLAH